MTGKAYIVSVDMGYGHQRAAYALRHLARGGIIIANNYPGIPRKAKELWGKVRKFYETISRLQPTPLVGELIFEVIDKTGRTIRLTKDRWSHINAHNFMSDKIEEIKQTLIKPDLIIPHKYDESKRNYYRYDKESKRYLLVAVKYLNGAGYISTSFITRKIIRR